MPNLEKVIKGLKCCAAMSGDECRKCPYEHECRGTELPPYGVPHLAADALALLKRQEPRVMTLEEVKHLRSLYDGAVWLEALSGLFPALPEMCMSNIMFFVAIPFDNYRKYFENEYYGKTWRCWTARPTDEQRKAVKWDD